MDITELPVYICPEGGPIKWGINIEENSDRSKLRLIIQTDHRQIYFRQRQPHILGNQFICEVIEF